MLYSRYSVDLADETVVTLEDNVKKFKRYGKILDRVARNLRGEEAKIGIVERDDAETAYVIFYPDGTYDRFENAAGSFYRDGWFGPELRTNNGEYSGEDRRGLAQAPVVEKLFDRQEHDVVEQILLMKSPPKKRAGRPRKIETTSPSAFAQTVAMAEQTAKAAKKEAAAVKKETDRKKKIHAKSVASRKAKAAVAKPVAKKAAAKKVVKGAPPPGQKYTTPKKAVKSTSKKTVH